MRLYDVNAEKRRDRELMESTFQNILDDIKNSKKAVAVLPSEDSIKAEVKNTYKINNKSLLAVLLNIPAELSLTTG